MTTAVASLRTTYTVGEWVAVTAPEAVLLMNVSWREPVVRRCWDAAREPRAIDDLVELLEAAGIPAFAVATMGQETQIAARGSARIVLDDGTAVEQVLADCDSSVFGAGTILLEAPGGREGLSLPIATGIGLAAAVRVELPTAAQHRQVSPPLAPATASVPAATPAPPPASAVGAPTGATVLAGRCVRGHLTPPYGSVCRVCGSALDEGEPSEVSRPPLGKLTFSDGAVVIIDRNVLIGRGLDFDDASDPADCHLVCLAEEAEGTSRRHAEIRLDGWNVLIVDLGSTNGTFLEFDDGGRIELAPDKPALLPLGATVNLADEVIFSFGPIDTISSAGGGGNP